METRHTQTTASSLHLDQGLQRLGQAITQTIDVEKIICFGSFSHRMVRKSCFGEVEDESRTMRNCYSLLVVLPVSRISAGAVVQQQVEEAAKPFAEATVIVHTMEEVNAALQNGSTFFTTICNKGAVLYDHNTEPFTSPGTGKPLAKRIIRREEFWNKWHDLAQGFLQGAAFYQSINRNNLAVYLLHQATQHGYAGVLRVMVGYRTNAQSLRRLLRLVEMTVPHLSLSLPPLPADTQLVDILLKGYSDARYKDTFEVTDAQVATLMDHVARLIDTADAACRKRIQQLKDGEVAYA